MNGIRDKDVVEDDVEEIDIVEQETDVEVEEDVVEETYLTEKDVASFASVTNVNVSKFTGKYKDMSELIQVVNTIKEVRANLQESTTTPQPIKQEEQEEQDTVVDVEEAQRKYEESISAVNARYGG